MFHRNLLVLLLLSVSAQAQIFQSGGSVQLGVNTYYAIADYNLDGRLDLVKGSGATGQITLSLGNTSGSFSTAQSTDVSIDTPTGLTPGDFNGDGKTDLAVFSDGLFSGPSVRVLLGSGTGTFTARPALVLPNVGRAAAAGDFDEDGNLDLAIFTNPASGTSLITILRGNSSGDLAFGVLSAPTTLPVPAFSSVGDLQALDLNADRHLDLVMTIRHTNGVGLAVAMGNGRASLTATATMGTQPPQTSPTPRLAVADFNGDQNLDVVIFGYFRDRVTLWINTGGVLSPSSSSAIGGINPYGIAAADFDLDGRMDWAVGRQVISGTPELHVALGNGGTGFTPAPGSPFVFGGSAPLLESGDFNGDRRTDLLIVEGTSDLFRVLHNSVQRPPTLLTQTILFPQIPDQGLDNGPLTLAASTNSGLPIAFVGMNDEVCTVSKGIATFITQGICPVLALQAGDQRYSPAPIVQQSFNITRNTQTITFAPLADRTLDASPFTVAATASSGLLVTFAAGPASVCTVNFRLVTLVSVGQCSVTAMQTGNGSFPAATPITRTFAVIPAIVLGPSVESIKNAASYAAGTLAPNAFGTLFGQRLGPNPIVTLRDAAGTSRPLELSFANETQLNFILPAGVAAGAATVNVTTVNGSAEFPVTVAATSPGLFSANFTGSGLAAAQALIVNNDRSITTLTVGDGPIPVRSGTEIYLVLYGTGIRDHTANGVFASVAGFPVEVLYAGAQNTYPALDQVNVRVPLTVGGLGTVDIRLTVDGTVANIVTATFQ